MLSMKKNTQKTVFTWKVDFKAYCSFMYIYVYALLFYATRT